MDWETQTDSNSLLFCSCCVLVRTNHCCREELCLITAQQRQLSFTNHWFVEANKSCMQAERDIDFFFFHENLIVAFVPAVCGSGRTDHLYCGSISVRTQEGLPARDLYSRGVLHKLSLWTRDGNKSKSTDYHFMEPLHSHFYCLS